MQESGFDIDLLDVPTLCRSDVKDRPEGLKSGGQSRRLVIVNTVLLGITPRYIADFVVDNVARVIPLSLAYKLAF